jgi:phage terminase small subunit
MASALVGGADAYCCLKTVTRYVKWVVMVNPKEQAKILQKQGMKLKDIAIKLGVSDRTLRNWGIKKNGKKETTKPEKGKTEKRKVDPTDKKIIESVMQNDELTDKRKLFCLYWINNRNATQAYLKAYGGSYDVANVEGPKLLVIPCVKTEIDRLRKLKAESIMLSEDDLVERYMRIAFADMTDFMEFGSYDVPLVVDGIAVKDSSGNIVMTRENSIRFKESKVVDGGLICEISANRQGTKIKLEDRQKALDFLAKYFDMNPDNKYRREFNEKKLQLEQDRFEHQKEMDKIRNW